MGEKVLLPHQQRVVDEKKELDEKIFKLDLFINAANFKIIVDVDSQILMKEQLDVMKDYSKILERRIELF